MIELLSVGQSEEDIKSGNYISKKITLQALKIGGIFPSYYEINSLYLDVRYEADIPCEFIAIKLSDIQEIVPDIYDFIKKNAKPYPGEEFLRKFYYYNDAWNKYKNALKYNNLADSINKESISKNDMKTKIYQRKDLNSFKLPSIFGEKKYEFQMKFF